MASNYSRKSASSGSRRGPAPQPARRSAGAAGTRRSAGNAPRAPRTTPRRPTAPAGRGVSPDVRDSRAARMQSHYNRYVRRVVLAVGVLLAAVALYAVLYFCGAFPVKQVTVDGATHLTNEEIAQIAAVPADSTLLRVDAAGIVSRLEGNAWVESAGVTRILPDTLRLDIRERTIQAVVQVPSQDGSAIEDWAIASDGVWLMKIPDRSSEEAAQVSGAVYADAESALLITDVPYGMAPVVGAVCTDENVNNALQTISGLSDNLASQVKTVSANGTEMTTLTLDNGVQIAFGDSDDVREKERVALQLLEEHEGQIAYINVRTPSRPTWRGL